MSATPNELNTNGTQWAGVEDNWGRRRHRAAGEIRTDDQSVRRPVRLDRGVRRHLAGPSAA